MKNRHAPNNMIDMIKTVSTAAANYYFRKGKLYFRLKQYKQKTHMKMLLRISLMGWQSILWIIFLNVEHIQVLLLLYSCIEVHSFANNFLLFQIFLYTTTFTEDFEDLTAAAKFNRRIYLSDKSPVALYPGKYHKCLSFRLCLRKNILQCDV